MLKMNYTNYTNYTNYLVALLAIAAAACGGTDSTGDPDGRPDGTDDAAGGSADGAPGGSLPTPNARFDYQLGGGYAPTDGIEIVARDRKDAPAAGLYNICYVNGFQTQPDERDFWTEQHPELLLRDSGGEVVIDPDWDEIILDVRSAEKRDAVGAIVGGWIDGCAENGFDAIEIDNLDTYSRSGGLVEQDDAIEFMKLLSARSHAGGMPIAQKNSAEVLGRRSEMETDFAVVEECNRFDECGDFVDVYGDQIYVIEYRRQDFNSGCSDFAQLSVVLRDLNLVTPDNAAYVFDDC